MLVSNKKINIIRKNRKPELSYNLISGYETYFQKAVLYHTGLWCSGALNRYGQSLIWQWSTNCGTTSVVKPAHNCNTLFNFLDTSEVQKSRTAWCTIYETSARYPTGDMDDNAPQSLPTMWFAFLSLWRKAFDSSED